MKAKLKETEKAYIAGFLDADGSIFVRIKPEPSHRFNYTIFPAVVFFQKRGKDKILKEIRTNNSAKAEKELRKI
jgi:hypothetical protein